MDNHTAPGHEDKPLSQSESEQDTGEAIAVTVPVPPKYYKQTEPASIWFRSFLSLAAYLVLGYYIFPDYRVLLLITVIVMIHELGHFIAMKAFRYKDLGIFFIPLLGAYVSGTKREVSQRQSAVILLAGPLPGIIIGCVFYQWFLSDPFTFVWGLPTLLIAKAFIFLNLINLFPVYPLDGGQLLNRVFLDEESWLSRIFIFLSIGALIWVALFAFSRPSYPLLLFPAMMIMRLFGDKRMNNLEKRIEAEGINTDCEYDDLPDEDYWKIRNIIIEEHPAFRDVPPSPPYEYHEKEERIMTTVQGLLHRHLLQDVSVAGKILILIIWAAGIASPWLVNMDLDFLTRLGR
ncbi:MAG: hypothetical protein JNM88_16255 [Chitinophagaceae bacterium]|nr:hypothetical protein [Chitinophagaceae bacterium]